MNVITVGTPANALVTARDLVAKGFSVFPVPRRTKVPLEKWKPYQTRFPTDPELVAWFLDVPMNIAIVTGAISDLVVVDCDNPDAVDWWLSHASWTPWQVASAKGVHFYYRHPGVHVATKPRWPGLPPDVLLDVKGDGGYIMAAGSLHPSGVRYAVAGDWTVARELVPRFDSAWLPPRKIFLSQEKSSGSPPSLPAGDVATRARAYLAAIPRPEIGCGSDAATFIAACRLVRGFDLSPEVAKEILWAWCGGRDSWSRDWTDAKVDYALKYGTEEFGGLLR